MFLIKSSLAILAILASSSVLYAKEEQTVIHINEDIQRRVESIRDYMHSEDYQDMKDISEKIVHKTLNHQKDLYSQDEIDDPKKTDSHNGLLSDRLYIFISSSMSKSTIRGYVREAAKISNSVIVMRGFIDGAHQVKPTVAFISDVLKKDKNCDHAQCEMQPVAFEIDPIKFQKYGITQVPAVVYEKQAIDGYCLEKKADINRAQKDLYKIVGESTLLYAVETLLKHQSYPGLVNMAHHIQPVPWESL